MLIISVPPQELKDAGKISSSVNLSGIRLKSVLVDETGIETFLDQNDTSEVTLKIDYKAEMKEIIDGKSLSSLVLVEAKLTKKESNLRLLVKYQVDYSLPNVPIPEHLNENMFSAFAQHNGLLNCWPYVRNQINHLSSEIGFPVLLPLLKIIPKKDDVAPEVKQGP